VTDTTPSSTSRNEPSPTVERMTGQTANGTPAAAPGEPSDEFSLAGARRAAARDELATWVRRFLASPGSDNAVLGEQLTAEPRWWTGPVRLPIHRLHRLAGPPDDPVLCPVDDDYWRDDVEEMAEKVDADGWEPPPVVVTFRDEQLVLEDGNHRVEALRRAGEDEAWAVVSFETTDARDRFAAALAVPPD
jgi:hypothetical protein